MRRVLLLFSLSFSVWVFSSQLLFAQTSPLPSSIPLDLAHLNRGTSPNGGAIKSPTNSQTGLTIASLWWAKDLFGNDTLDNWLAYPGDSNNSGRIDLIVNQQNWLALDYIQRYEFVNNFGTVARNHGYNIRVFNSKKERLAAYTCDFSTNPLVCSIQLDATGKASLRGSTGRLGI